GGARHRRHVHHAHLHALGAAHRRRAAGRDAHRLGLAHPARARAAGPRGEGGMSAARVELDVARLPTTTFGHRNHLWWGTLGFMLIEGTTFVICVASYFYLRLNFPTWPPEHTLLPSLLWPTVHVAVMLA